MTKRLLLLGGAATAIALALWMVSLASPPSAYATRAKVEGVCIALLNGDFEITWEVIPEAPGDQAMTIVSAVVDEGSLSTFAPNPIPSGGTATAVTVVSGPFSGNVQLVIQWSYPAGQNGQASEKVNIPDDCVPLLDLGEGRFTGGGHQIRVDGVRVTRGLTIHCDLLLSNNLEVNWSGNQFHMTEHLTTVACTDDPAIIQAPPAAPLDTLVGVGTGRYNNVDGFTIEFTLVDQGEPGRNDQMAILIYETANPGNVVLDIPLQTLDGGNLQAHFDQPHK